MPVDVSLARNLAAGIVAVTTLLSSASAEAQTNNGAPQILPTGQLITPLVPNGASFQPLNPNLADNLRYTVGQAVTTVLSPDGKTLLILTSGYNLLNYISGPNAGEPDPTDSTEFVFVFDLSTGNAIQKQALPLPATYSGIAFNPSGQQFYVAGGVNDDVHIFGVTSGTWSEVQPPVALGHMANRLTFSDGGLGLFTQPMAAGLAVSQNGDVIVVCNYENDSISVLTQIASAWIKSAELDLRPGVANPAATGIPGGEYPYWVSIKGNSTAYVSSERDREIDVVNIDGTPAVTARIPVPGTPNRSVLNQDQSILYVAQDNSDSVAVIDTNTNLITAEIEVTAPVAQFDNALGYKGANPNSVALSPDGSALYVTDGGLNAVVMVSLNKATGSGSAAGLIPTGFYPNSVTVSADGTKLYIVNGKSAAGANPLSCFQSAPNPPGSGEECQATNSNVLALTKAGFQIVPTPVNGDLISLTKTVLQNDHLPLEPAFNPGQIPPHPPAYPVDAKMLELRKRIQHVIYIIKENRTYDQVLGDLEVGNGDPSLAQFGLAITPNSHAIAKNFVDFDNFYDVSEVSGDGWPWSTSARTTDNIEKEVPVFYGGRGGNYNSEGTNRSVNVGIANLNARIAADTLIGTNPNLLPGASNVAAPDSAEGGAGEGYIWNAALSAGLSVRSYGFFVDLVRYRLPGFPQAIPIDPNAFADNLQVAYSTSPALSPYTDLYYRGFDFNLPEYFRFTEWNREFQQFDTNGNLPSLSLVRLGADHTGVPDNPFDGVTTPELQVADNDYAVGLLVQAVAHSKNFSSNTLIFVIEDDAQAGPDHVDAHRSTAYIAGPYVKQGYVDSTFYNTVNMLRTIEDILAIPHLNLNDAHASPMDDAFDLEQATWTFNAEPSAFLAQTQLPIPPTAFNPAALLRAPKPLHSAAWWTRQAKGMDFAEEDRVDAQKYNHILWKGIMGDKPYPKIRSGADLRINRAQLLNGFYERQTAR